MEKAVERYLQGLRMKKEVPTVNYLQRLIQQQLSRVPYENFSKFHYAVEGILVPSFERYVDEALRRGWGGTCYTLNFNFARLLTYLGFDVHLVRVNPGHVGLQVILENRAFYVDVGYGSPLMKPIELESRREQTMQGFGEKIRFIQSGDNRYTIERSFNGKVFVTKEIEWTALQEEDFIEDMKASYRDDVENVTMNRLTAVRFSGNECYFLRNDTIKIMTYRARRELKLKDEQRWLHTVQQVYQVDEETLKSAVGVLKEKELDLFLS
ncbi:arylamine N-acetyltransferase [Mangrovibacillus cuniculi]|uniref:Arylamine N-acetyltransferase n=1 Tax=Mangrovibacillus cuniculi TaxID=2593652 RepID=A0A7S8C8T2_9BACI|nr:arylamine N-acetyltransferase [Mangrovibacillus cuniculi]QPC45507.1 arylamine N-acetyltransferase [Mangrovibacillus cuniculi]